MSKQLRAVKPSPTDLTWEERNPSSYLFNVKVLTDLEKVIEKVSKKGNGLRHSAKHRRSHASPKRK